MNIENQNAVEENEVVSVDVEETEQQTSQSEIPVVPEKEETRTNVQEKQTSEQTDELEDYSENVKKRINQLTAKRKQALEEADAAFKYAEEQKKKNAFTIAKKLTKLLKENYSNIKSCELKFDIPTLKKDIEGRTKNILSKSFK